MNVGICKIKIRLPDNHSLKGKRQLIRPIIAQLGNKFNVSVAEVSDQDMWQLATIGIGFVSDDSRFTNEVLSRVVDFIENGHFDIEILDYETEIIPV
jgi:uncharacterized protein